MRTVADFEKMIKSALKAAARYSKSLDVQIFSLASALRALELANNDLDGIDCCTLETERSIIAHPAFKIRTDAETSVTRQMKQLGLTTEALGGEVREDPMVALTKKVRRKQVEATK